MASPKPTSSRVRSRQDGICGGTSENLSEFEDLPFRLIISESYHVFEKVSMLDQIVPPFTSFGPVITVSIIEVRPMVILSPTFRKAPAAWSQPPIRI